MDNIKPLPDNSDVENLNESESIEYVSNVIKKLEILKDNMNLDEIKDCLQRISLLYFDCNYLDKIYDYIIRNNQIDLFYFYLQSLHSKLKVTDEILNSIYNFLINFSDNSINFAREIYSSKILSFVIDNCINNEYANEESFLTNCVNLIHNIARDLDNKITHKLSELKQSLVKFIIENNENNLAILSMLTLSYIVEGSEIKLLDEGSNTIKRLLGLISKTMQRKERKGNYTMPELMRGIYYISSNNEMKLKIVENGGIEILIEILNANIENEIEFTLGIIYNLCFDETIKRKLIDTYRIVDVIERFRNHKLPEIKGYFDGIIWEIEDRKKTFHQQEEEKSIGKPEDKKYFDVFISYAHENQSKVLEIRENLMQYNIRVWIDKEQMTGSILEAMARGIENSKIFIIGMSKYYKIKPNCRSEAEYAYQRQKPIIPMILENKFKPDGWLGILQGTKLYFEFSERRNTQEVLQGLVRSITKSLEEIGCSVEEIEKVENEKIVLSNKDDSFLKKNEMIKNWSKIEVNKWLEKSKMDHLKKKLNELDGSLLYLMLDIRLKSPEYFNNTLKNEFGMKFIDVLKFHRALNELTV